MIELNHLDYAIIHKSKIDPIRLFGNSYTIELQGYIIYLINSGKEVPQELFSEITREERYDGNFPQVESICVDILNTLLKKGFDIEDEKYNDVLLGVQSNDSMSENFIYGVVRENFPFPLSFAYIYEDYPKESYFIFRDMVERDYTHEIPDFIIEAICNERYYTIATLAYIIENFEEDDGNPFYKYIDNFTTELYKEFNNIIDQTKDLKNILKNSNKEYEEETKLFYSYGEDLQILLNLIIKYGSADEVPILMDFFKSKKFQDHINIYLKFAKKFYNGEDTRLKKLLDKVMGVSIKESLSFKSFFYNR